MKFMLIIATLTLAGLWLTPDQQGRRQFERSEFEAAAGFGWTVGETSFDWPTLRDNKTKEIERLNGIYDNMLKNAGVKIIHGRGTVVDAHTVAVDGKNYTAERILVAVGGWPMVPDIAGSEHIISSNEVFYLD